MGHFSLVCHPQTPARAVSAITIDWRVAAGQWWLDYGVVGAGDLIVPPLGAPARADGLWKTTCFELFLGQPGTHYREFNFSPSGRWATYAFNAYREGGHDAPMSVPPVIAAAREGDDFRASVALTSDLLHHATSAGLTAVIEEAGGHLSYWALAHAPGKPDFHARSCFTVAIGAAEAP